MKNIGFIELDGAGVELLVHLTQFPLAALDFDVDDLGRSEDLDGAELYLKGMEMRIV